jgi:uncharacterized protein YgiM (DUF1202 family)
MKNIFLISLFLISFQLYAQPKFDAVIVGETIRIRSDAKTTAKVVFTLNTGEAVNIISKTDKRTIIPLDNDYCDKYGYYWYKIKTADGLSGWVYGAFLYVLNTYNNKYLEGLYSSSINTGGKEFLYDFAEVNSIGIANETELTDCDELKIPFLYIKGNQRIYPIMIGESKVDIPFPFAATKEKNWLLLTSSTGISENVNNIKVINNTVVMLIKRNFQDSSADAIFTLTFKSTYFEAILIKYKKY